MEKTMKVVLACVLLFWASESRSQEQVFQLGNHFGVGARAMGMGGASIAVSEDWTGSYWNPAGLAQIRKMELLGALSHLASRDEASFGNSMTPATNNFTHLNSLGFVFPVPTYRGSLVFAGGFHRARPFDGHFEFRWFNPSPNDSVNQSWTELETGALSEWSFAGAVDITPNLSLGGALNLWTGDDDYKFSFQEQDNLDIYTFRTYRLDDAIETNYRGVNLKLGALYRANRALRLGATVSTPLTLTAKENWSTGERLVKDDGKVTDTMESGRFEYKIRSPLSLSGGASLIVGNLLLAGDAEWNDWSQVEYQTDPPLAKLSRTEANLAINEKYRSTVRGRLGAELQLPLVGVSLRGGYLFDPSPLKDAPKDFDRQFVTFGAGFLLDRQVKVDLAYVRGWWKGPNGPVSDGTAQYDISEDVTVHQFFGTMAIRF